MYITKMKICLVFLLSVGLVGAGREEINANEIKRRMKLIGGIPSYGIQNIASKVDDKPNEDEIQYEDPPMLVYNSSTYFNPRGMGHLYFVTKFFMDFLLPSATFPDGLIVTDENTGQMTFGKVKENWMQWLQHYSAIAAVAAVGLVFVVLMPIVGLFFCCCRCGGKCGARVKHEKRHDSCKRTTVAILLGGVAVIILFGVVCAFVTNEHMKEGIEDFPTNVSNNMELVHMYLNHTEKEVEFLLVKNFKQLRQHIEEKIGDAGEIVKNQLAVVSHAVALTNLTNIVSGMEVVKQDLAAIQKSTGKLQELAETLGDDLDVTREELLKELYNCRDIPACRELLNHHQVAELKVVEDFSGLPNVAYTFASISRLLGDQNSFDSIQRKVSEGQKNFNNIKYEISEALQDVKPNFEASFNDAEQELGKMFESIQINLNAIHEFIENFTKQTMKSVSYYIDEYAIYRYYLGLGVSGVLLLILLCITFGLLCGICGKRPEEMYSDDGDCCNTVSGGRFLMTGVWLIFLFSSALMLVTLGHFLIGIGTELLICQPLNNPSENKTFAVFDELLDFSFIADRDSKLKMSEMIVSFHQNKSIFDAFKMKKVDVEQIKHQFELKQKIGQFKSRINVRTDRLELLTPDAREKLRDLANSPLNDINFDKYAQLLNVQITNINLTQLSQELRSNAEKIPDHATSGFDLTKIKKLLRAKARFLELLQRDAVSHIRQEILVLKSNVTTLKEHLKFNHTSLRDALENLLDEVNRAQLYLRKNGTTELKVLLYDFVNKYEEEINKYIERVSNKASVIGSTAPLSNAYNGTVVSGCKRVMYPFNGFWVSIGWSVLLFIPVIILSVKLARLYTKSEAYGPPGIYGESEYLYDAYADRDNMPLAMTQVDKKKKNHHKKYQDSYENGGNAYLQDYSAHLGRQDRGASASNDARYHDMAPKHWGDFPNARGNSGGPPRYHHPTSTEYERPPPYYYPGPERS